MITVDTRRPSPAMPTMLIEHLKSWAGALPENDSLRVVRHAKNGRAGWDGRAALLTGLIDPAGSTVLSVPSTTHVAEATALFAQRAEVAWSQLPAMLGRPGHTVERVAFRWCTRPAELPEVGVWVDSDSERVPSWLRPFGGQSLVAFDEGGRYLAGVGIKRHDRFAQEIAVVTDPRAQGRGLARSLVAQAARRILAGGHIPTYLHTLDNHASARVAEAVGFADRGWGALMLSDEPVENAA